MPLKNLRGNTKIVVDLLNGAVYFVLEVPTTTDPRGGLICEVWMEIAVKVEKTK